MTHLSDPERAELAYESRRSTHTARRKIGSGVAGLCLAQGQSRPRCGAVAGTSVHAPMT